MYISPSLECSLVPWMPILNCGTHVSLIIIQEYVLFFTASVCLVFKNVFYVYGYFYLHICQCVMCMQLPQRSKEGSRSRGTRVTYGYELGIEPESWERTANTLNYRTISPGPKLGFIQDLGAFKRKKASKTCSFKWGFKKNISLNHCQPSGRWLSTFRAILSSRIYIQKSYSTVTIAQWSARGV